MPEMNKEAKVGELSVVVVPLVGEDHLVNCLDALYAQTSLPAEIIVPYDERLENVTGLKKAYPKTQFIEFRGRRTVAELRAEGIRKSRGAVVAITEDHCKPDQDWCAVIEQLHAASSHAAIGGAVEKETPDTALDWALYFADYLRYSTPLPEGLTHALTDLNVSYKREALAMIKPAWAAEFHENIVHAALEERGQTLWLAPQVVVRQKRRLTLQEAIWDRYAFGRLFGSSRVAGQAPSRRLIFTVTSLILPVLLVSRVVSHIRQKRRWMSEFVRSLPALVLISTIWSWGEFLGYLTGRPDKTMALQAESA
jgi:hypothetical protein